MRLITHNMLICDRSTCQFPDNYPLKILLDEGKTERRETEFRPKQILDMIQKKQIDYNVF